MASFLFQSTRNILCELGSSKHVGRLLVEELHVSPKQAKSVLMVSDKGITQRGIELGACEDLAEHGFEVLMFDDVVADPPESVVADAIELAKAEGVQAVVGLGGGSSMDVAKLVAYLAHPKCQHSFSDIYGVGNCHGSRLPLIQVPTTAGTGSEVTPISIITTGENEKKGVVSPVLLPDFAVLDGELTKSLPADVTAATGVDAMVHAIEAFTSKTKKNPLSDLLAREALRLLGGNIESVCSNPDDLGGRSDMLLGSMYAGMAFANAPVAAVHALAYPIGSHFHVPHGLSNALMLPHVLRFNEPQAGSLYAELNKILFPGADAAPALADNMSTLANKLGMVRTLDAVGISASDVDMLATEAMKQTRLLPNNPREVTKADAVSLYTQALSSE